jgi:class 3 adenylate cyclase
MASTNPWEWLIRSPQEVAVERPPGTVPFLFTDIVGSTRLWEAHPQEMRQVPADHERLLRAVFERHSGYVFAAGGDSFSVAFTTPDEAVRAALDGQQALREGPFGVVGGLPVRMAIHIGLTPTQRTPSARWCLGPARPADSDQEDHHRR